MAYIDVDNAITALLNVLINNPQFESQTKDAILTNIEFLKAQPVVDVVEVKHGKWIYKHRHRGGFDRMTAHDEYGNPHTVTIDNRYECDEPYCSVCGKLGGDFLNYCGNCGAKMDGGKAE